MAGIKGINRRQELDELARLSDPILDGLDHWDQQVLNREDESLEGGNERPAQPLIDGKTETPFRLLENRRRQIPRNDGPKQMLSAATREFDSAPKRRRKTFSNGPKAAP